MQVNVGRLRRGDPTVRLAWAPSLNSDVEHSLKRDFQYSEAYLPLPERATPQAKCQLRRDTLRELPPAVPIC